MSRLTNTQPSVEQVVAFSSSVQRYIATQLDRDGRENHPIILLSS